VPATWIDADLLVPGEAKRVVAVVQPSHLLHLAWYAEPGQYWTSRENLRWVKATVDLAAAFVDRGGRRLLGVGSCAEYEWAEGHCDEGLTRMAPATLYGASKLAAGHMTGALASQAGVSAAWARLFFLFGPHEHPARLVSSVVRALVRGDDAPCSEGSQVRDFLYVKDVASALVAVLEHDISGPVNIGSGRPTTVKELVTRVGDLVGQPARLLWGARPADPVRRLTAATERLHRTVGWRPAFTVDAALTETIDWWRARERDGRA
jgi:nucleoside-diphosphate-sugar epimerase